MTFKTIKHFLLGKPLDPFKQETRQHIALITLFAWIGLGADGISSSAYGPEEAFAALGDHTQLAVFLALATAVTVFIIAISYLQVIELFPRGGGGYKVASKLLGPRAGLVAGSALIIDYVLTIAISTASAIDSLFSAFPPAWQPYTLYLKFIFVIVLTYINLRGIKESIKILTPVFMGFIVMYTGLICYGIITHSSGLGQLVPEAITETETLAGHIGWYAVLILFFKAFSMGGGTYTGLEAVSNSLHNLAEPRVRTGKNTMLCVAASLAFMAMGIILLYLLWNVTRVPGQTMNATVFGKITEHWHIGDMNISNYVVGIAMLFTAGLLLVAANTGFIAGPAVLANMAVDRWMPYLFSALSSRLVTKHGILMMGIASLLALAMTQGKVHILVILYSINVFLTFTLSLAGICRYRWRRRRRPIHSFKLIIPFLALLICSAILTTTLCEKFFQGAWMTVLVTGLVILIGLLTKHHYTNVQKRIEKTEEDLSHTFACVKPESSSSLILDHDKPTAVFVINETSASGMYTLLWVQKVFPHMFENFIFLSVGEIDTEEFQDEDKWIKLRRSTKTMLKRYVNYCHCKGWPSTYYHTFGTDMVDKLTHLTDYISTKYPKAIFFAAKLTSDNENILTQLLHNQTAYILQRRLHNKGQTMIIIPMKL